MIRRDYIFFTGIGGVIALGLIAVLRLHLCGL
jgi:hypothetical protein